MFYLDSNQSLRENFRKIFKNNFIHQSAEIYGGEKGLYDYGNNADSIMDNIICEWKKFFVYEERMLKIKSTMLTPEKVLQASGHVDRFNDFLVTDSVTLENYRTDHLIEKFLEDYSKDKTLSTEKVKEVKDIIQVLDNYGEKELSELILRFNIKSPNNNLLTPPRPFNLMFSTSIGPSGDIKGYLRPETAQGIFIMFKRLRDHCQGKLPFAVAQIGSSFRNEIAPRQGLLRVREFEMAEIEHFLDPLDKSHPKFKDVADLNINMFPSSDQISGKSASLINLGDAVAKKLVANETLGYFVGRIYLFLTKIGIKHDLLRFRQHMPNEMAHYASDCWDAECMTSYGWVECVGCADRSCYDLERHSECSGTMLVAQRQLDTPRHVKRAYCKPNMKVIGSTFKKNGPTVAKYIESLSCDEASRILAESGSVNIDGVEYALSPAMGDILEEDQLLHTEDFVPSVIEPSFGLGRIFYSLMEQNFNVRDGDLDRSYFTVPPIIAGYKFSILPLSSKDVFVPLTETVESILRKLEIEYIIDNSGASIGKRYARKDMIGVPFGITIDFESVSVSPASVTVRDRDSMTQVRVKVDDLRKLAKRLANGRLTWHDACLQYPVFTGQNL